MTSIRPKLKEDKNRLKVLSNKEQEEVFSPPKLDTDELYRVFSLDEAELEAALSFRSYDHKVIFILKLGYFKEKGIIFPYVKKRDSIAAKYVAARYIEHDRKYWPSPKVQTTVQQSRIDKKLLGFLNAKKFARCEAKALALHIASLAKINPKPSNVMRKVIVFLRRNKISIPEYSTLQDLIGSALKNEQNRITDAFSLQCNKQIKSQIRSLLKKSGTMKKLSDLKKDPKSFSYKQVDLEVTKAENLTQIFAFSKKFVDKAEISAEAVAYYSGIAERYYTSTLSRLSGDQALVYLVLFVNQKMKKINNDLIKSLLYHVSRFDVIAKNSQREEAANALKESKKSVAKAEKVWAMLNDPDVSDNASVGDLRSDMFTILTLKEFTQFHKYLKRISAVEDKDFYWTEIEKQANRFKRYTRQVLRVVTFDSTKKKSSLKSLMKIAQKKLIEGKTLKEISIEEAKKVLPQKSQKYFLSEKANLNTDRFEFWLYSKVKDEIEAGHFYCEDSMDFRSLDNDLIDKKSWEKNRNKFLDRAGLTELKAGPEATLNKLRKKLKAAYKKTNSNINSGKNPYFKPASKGTSKKNWSLLYESSSEKSNKELFFKSHPQVSIISVLRTVDDVCNWKQAFTNVSGNASNPDLEPLLATIIALGTNMGVTKMAAISDIPASRMSNYLTNYVLLEQVKAANNLVASNTAEYPTHTTFNLSNKVHASSDGQKFETQRPTIKARYSPKYFGLEKGISSYSVIANHIPINATIIGANEHESHFVFDLLFNNKTTIQPEVHSTDSHGVNSLNFLLLDMFGLQFAPRYKNIRRAAVNNLVGFKGMDSSIYGHFAPKKIFNECKFIAEWDEMLRVLCSLALQESTQSTIVRKLSSHKGKNSLKQALWQWDSILKSIFILEYGGI